MISLSKIKRNFEDITSADNEKPEIDTESQRVARILPDELYKQVARIIDLDENVKEKITVQKKKSYRRLYKGVRHLSRAIHAVTFEKDYSQEYYSDSSVEPPTLPRNKIKSSVINPYYDFFQKTEREQIRWATKYLPPETEMEKGLIRRADELTDKICSDFCTYMQNLGGYISPLFKEDTVKQLFQIEFNAHIAHSLNICPAEMISVTKQVAAASNINNVFEKNVLATLIKKDVSAERKASNKIAFGKILPKSMQWTPPKNDTVDKWMNIVKAPSDIITMKNVWSDITALKSVQSFCEWIIEHPDPNRPSYLRKCGMLRSDNLNKLKRYHQYDAVNQLPKIDIESQLTSTYNRRMSVPPMNIKITRDVTNNDNLLK